ncbi:MAG TPA: pentapeptide repeat-containing protein, partial [Candidatus Angelobacter sp.]|nr:pentapeptide repeat-containing protein [Candidatus Angelobacter sp.]
MSAIAEDHAKWLRTYGRQGQRACFRGMNLSKVKFKDEFRQGDLSFADFADACVSDAVFAGCVLRLANLNGVSGLRWAQLNHTDLEGASLPESISWESQQGLLESTSATARSTYFTMVAGCVYLVLAILNTTDYSLITNSTSLLLPIINVTIPVTMFYLVAPLVICTIYVYFVSVQHRILNLLRRMPQVLPDGSRPWEAALSWLPFAEETRGKRARGLAAKIIGAVPTLTAYSVPPIVLLLLWERYLAADNWRITFYHILAFAVAVVVCSFSFTHGLQLAERTENGGRSSVALAGALAAVLLYLSVSVLMGGPPPKGEYSGVVAERPAKQEDIADRNTYYAEVTNGGAWATTGRGLFLLLGLHPYPNLTRARGGDASGGESSGAAFPTNWAEPYLPARNAYLVSAQFMGCNLKNMDLRGAVLSKAKLEDCGLEGAVLSGAKLDGVDASEARFQGSILINADLTSSRLSGIYLTSSVLLNATLDKALMDDAHLENAILSNADVNEVNLTGAVMDGANLSAARLRK